MITQSRGYLAIVKVHLQVLLESIVLLFVRFLCVCCIQLLCLFFFFTFEPFSHERKITGHFTMFYTHLKFVYHRPRKVRIIFLLLCHGQFLFLLVIASAIIIALCNRIQLCEKGVVRLRN